MKRAPISWTLLIWSPVILPKQYVCLEQHLSLKLFQQCYNSFNTLIIATINLILQ